jgi:NADPH:quinone reductase
MSGPPSSTATSTNPTTALIVTEPGDGRVLQVQARDIPDPGPGELLVEVAASGVNFVEVYQRQGVYPMPTPFVLGAEGAGRVTALGSDVTGFAVGDIVAWAAGPGSHAGLVIVAADKAVPVPDGLDPQLAAAVMLQGMTAHYLVNSTYPVQPGDSVLVHAAAGGVGQLLVQLAKAHGARVIGTVSTEAKAEKVRALGAEVAIRYSDSADVHALAGAIREANGGNGVTVAYDGVGQATFEASLAALAPRGMGVLFGGASGQVPPFDLQRLNQLGGLYVTRPSLGHYTATRAELLWRGRDVLAAVADGGLRVEIGGRYPLGDAAQAYDDLENRRTTGKLLLHAG